MPILGHGIDIVETARIRKLVERPRPALPRPRLHAAPSSAYCARNPKRYYEHLAGRFAAKEAVLKVLGTGWRGGIAWTDIEIVKEPSGQPKIALTGECQRIATRARHHPLARQHQPHRNPRDGQRDRPAGRMKRPPRQWSRRRVHSLSKSSGRGWSRHTRPLGRQHFLKPPPGAARAEVIAAKFLDQFLHAAATTRTPRLTCVSDGNPLRRLLVRSKARPFPVLLEAGHKAPPEQDAGD